MPNNLWNVVVICFLISACASDFSRQAPQVTPENIEQDVRPLLELVANWVGAYEGAECKIIEDAHNFVGVAVSCDTADTFRFCLPKSLRQCVKGIRGIKFSFRRYQNGQKNSASIRGDFLNQMDDDLNGVFFQFEKSHSQWELKHSYWTQEIIVAG